MNARTRGLLAFLVMLLLLALCCMACNLPPCNGEECSAGAAGCALCAN